MILISIESTSLMSAANTSRILYPLLRYLLSLDWERFEHWHFFIRKGGHVLIYGTLCVLLFRAWRATLPSVANARWTWRWASLAVLGTAMVASLDEWHQSFLPSRTGVWQDVVLDTCAGIAAQILFFVWLKSVSSRLAARSMAEEQQPG